MTALVYLVPIALLMGLAALAAFLWALRTGQFEDLEGAAWRILDDGEAVPPGEPGGAHGRSRRTP